MISDASHDVVDGLMHPFDVLFRWRLFRCDWKIANSFFDEFAFHASSQIISSHEFFSPRFDLNNKEEKELFILYLLSPMYEKSFPNFGNPTRSCSSNLHFDWWFNRFAHNR